MNRSPLVALAFVWVTGCAGAATSDASQDGQVGRDVTAADGSDAPIATDVPTTADVHDAADADLRDSPDADQPCLRITPGASPSANRMTINACLATRGFATLLAGDFPIDDRILVPDNAHLLGAAGVTPRPRIVFANAGWNSMVAVASRAEVGNLRLDANGRIGSAPNGSIVHLEGSESNVHDCEIYNSPAVRRGIRNAAIYVIGATSAGNVAANNDMHDSFYGIIFRAGISRTNPNVARANEIHGNTCDSVSLAGFGRIVGNDIHHNGFDCQNGATPNDPIPGGGVYCLNNDDGGEIIDNRIHDQCGMNVDIDRCGNFVIRGNTLERPGIAFAGQPPCGGAQSMGIVDSHDFTIVNNTVLNDGARNRIRTDPNNIFNRPQDNSVSDLPAGDRSVIAFVLARRRGGPEATSSTIDNNILRAYCDPADCVGVGYFVGRGTGTTVSGVWSAATTNYFTRNDPRGSNIGSRRCGANWYAGSSTCGSDPMCNFDDAQHPLTPGNYRNDDCRDY